MLSTLEGPLPKPRVLRSLTTLPTGTGCADALGPHAGLLWDSGGLCFCFPGSTRGLVSAARLVFTLFPYLGRRFEDAVALAKTADVVVLMLGIDGSVEGESEDRTSIDLPAVQHELAAAVVAVGKPVVVVLVYVFVLHSFSERVVVWVSCVAVVHPVRCWEGFAPALYGFACQLLSCEWCGAFRR